MQSRAPLASFLFLGGTVFLSLHKGCVWSLCTMAMVEYLSLCLTGIACTEVRVLGAKYERDPCLCTWIPLPTHGRLRAYLPLFCVYSQRDDLSWEIPLFLSSLPSIFLFVGQVS